VIPGSIQPEKESNPFYPYYGDYLLVHFGENPAKGNRHLSKFYPPDVSGKRTYTFNSIGFRGDEFNPLAKKTIFVCGGSVAVGVGVADEELWACQFKKKFAALRQLGQDEVNVMNFSQAAASNDYTVRTLLSQCGRLKPDMVIAHLGGGEARTEWFDHEFYHSVGPWIVDSPGTEKIYEAGKGYYSYYTPELGLINVLKNILLLQFFCEARNIELIVLWTGYNKLSQVALLQPFCQALAKMINMDNIFLPRDAVDWVIDVHHPGPSTHKLLALQLTDICQLSGLHFNSVLCHTSVLRFHEEKKMAIILKERHFQLTDDMFTLVKLIDGESTLSQLLYKAFGISELPPDKSSELLQALRLLVRFGVLHFKSSITA